MADIVERLRGWAMDLQFGREIFGADLDLRDAANEIERLRAALEQIAELEPYERAGPAVLTARIALETPKEKAAGG